MITFSTDNDFEYIRTWQHAEHVRVGMSFWNNWTLVKRAHKEGRLLVLRVSDKAVAYHTQGEMLNTDSIFAVHPNWRRMGLGSKLAAHIIEKASQTDAVLLEIDCSITGSEPFWQSLGFQLAEGQDGDERHHAYLSLEKSLPLPEIGAPVQVTVRFSAANGTALLSEHRTEGKLLADGSIALAKRIIGFSKPTSPDIGVTVEVGGKQIGSRTRAKYQGAAGFIYKDGAIQADQLWPQRWEA